MSEDEDRQRERRLERIRSQFDLAERAAHIGHWRLDLVDDSYFWSPGFYRLLGEDPTIRKPDREWLFAQMTPESRTTIDRAIANAIRTHTPFSYRTYSRDPKRAVQIVDTQGEVEVDENGRPAALFAVCQDVTARVRAEEAREKAQAMYRLMAEESGDIIILYSMDSDLLFASQALERITGRTVDEIKDGGYKRFVHPDDFEEAQKMFDRRPDGDNMTATWRMMHRDGHYVWIETTIRTVYDPKTEGPKNIISVSRDITARKAQEFEIKAARDRAEAANMAKSRFLANMSHELRTPLNAIIGFADLMREKAFGPLGNDRYEGYAKLIYDSGHLLLELITDMLDMAKIEAGRLELTLERVDLTETVGEVLRLLQDRAQTSGLTLLAEPAEKLSLLADRRAVKQILINLVGNALKFTPVGGEVRVSTALDGDFVRLTVSDTGIGIPKDQIGRLGKPFEQVCDDPNLAKAGTGLGLALVRALSQMHGGAMSIESTEGVGTRVSVTFARKPPARVQAA